jgi:hypothetical protein
MRGMSDEAFQNPPSSDTVDQAGAAPASPALSFAMVGMITALCWVVSLLLPNVPPLFAPDTAENWLQLGMRCLRGTLEAIGILGICLIVSMFVPRVGLFFEGLVLRSSRRRFLLATVLISTVSSGLFAWFFMSHTTHIVDETAMLFQARVLASGRLYADCPPMPEFFDAEFVIADPPRWYGKYFIGQSLFLVPGVWIGAPWLIHPILIGLSVWLTYLLGLELLNDKPARVAAVLMVLSPLRLYTGGTMMGHASSLFVLLAFAYAMVKMIRQPARWGWGALAGFSLGMACNARPLTVIGMAGVIGLAAAVKYPWRQFNWRTAAAFVVTLGLWACIFFAYNKALTGDAMLTPFNKWSKGDRLGFGADVGLEYWRKADKGHSLRRGLLIDSYYNFDVLGDSLTGWGHVTLVLLVLPIIFGRWRWQSLLLFGVWLALAGIHVFHVSSGVLFGQPRYWSEAMPMMLLVIAVALALIRSRVPAACRMLGLTRPILTGRSAVWLAGVVLAMWCVYGGYYPLVSSCYGWTWGQHYRLGELAKERGIDNAVVFLRTGHYREQNRGGKFEPDRYLGSFPLNDPELTSRVVYARHLGFSKDAELMRYFPGRKAFYFDPSALQEDAEFMPLDRAAARLSDTTSAESQPQSTAPAKSATSRSN